VRQVLERSAPKRLTNGYGPTECTTFAVTYEVKEVPDGATTVPIGRPLANTDVYVLDERMQPVPVGVTGELYLGGVGLAWGYLNRPELTAERFVPHPFSPEPTAKLYRTGDLVRYRPDGNIEFLGRRDAQVKVRGFRIELGEVEAALARHPGVGTVTVMAREDGPGGKQLVAYVVPREGQSVELGGLRAFLKELLPEYMLPSAFVRLEALPLTPNGKVDRKALPAPEQQRAELGGAYVVPEVGVEQSLAAIWSEVLRLDRVGADDNFFDLGGNSLLLQTVHARLESLVGRRVPLVALFQFPTVRALASHLSGVSEPVAVAEEASTATGGNRRERLRQLAQHRRGRPGSN
jgi:acyl carrier protein